MLTVCTLLLSMSDYINLDLVGRGRVRYVYMGPTLGGRNSLLTYVFPVSLKGLDVPKCPL